MKLSDGTIEKLLLSAKKVTKEQLQELKAEATKSKKGLQETVIAREIVTPAQLTELYAEVLSVPYVSIDTKKLSKETVSVIPERMARQYSAVVYKTDEDGTHHIALSDPDDVQAIDFIKKYIGDKFKIYIATDDDILQALEFYRDGVESQLDKVIEIQKEGDIEEEKISEDDIAEDSPIAQTVNLILEYAIRAGASDIHIEPRDDHVSVRYRIDGVLREANKLPKNVHGALVSRIKILSNLKIDERRVPQDGRFKITLTSRAYAFRVSTLPITAGEKVVMRILNESTKALTLEQLGYWGRAKERVNEAIVQPHGRYR